MNSLWITSCKSLKVKDKTCGGRLCGMVVAMVVFISCDAYAGKPKAQPTRPANDGQKHSGRGKISRHSGKRKARHRLPGSGAVSATDKDQAESVFRRLARRETLRDAVFLCITPFVAARISSGCAALKAAVAAAVSPEAKASSTFRT